LTHDEVSKTDYIRGVSEVISSAILLLMCGAIDNQLTGPLIFNGYLTGDIYASLF